MSRIRSYLSKYSRQVSLVLVAVALAVVLLLGNSGSDGRRMASKASAGLEKRFEALDEFAAALLTHYSVKWPDIGEVPRDMVLYRYRSDTLDCWYNLFSVDSDDIAPVLAYTNLSNMLGAAESPLKKAGPDPSMFIMNGKWYVVKLYANANTKVIAGLLIKDETKRDRLSGVWVNPCLHAGWRNTVALLEEDGGEVCLAGEPVFKLADARNSSEMFFSPLLNTDVGQFFSLGNLLLFNALLFFIILIVHLCRRKIRAVCCSSKTLAVSIISLCSVAALCIMFHCVASLSRVVEYSSITLGPRWFASLDWYSLLVYVSYASLCVSAYLVTDLALSIIAFHYKKSFSLRRSLPALICAVVFSAALCTVITHCEFKKEQGQMAILSSRLAIAPAQNSTDLIPPFFSYARYRHGHLTAFKGNFAYPLVLSHEYAARPNNDSQNTILVDGYRHFINYVSDSDLIILSREELGFLSFFVMFSFLVISLFLFMYIFRVRHIRGAERTRLFSTKIKRLIIYSLVSTLVVMATVSVVFVYQRSERNYRNTMSAKISSLQIILDSYCADKKSYKDMISADFIEKLKQMARATQSDILLYAPTGRLVMCSSVELMGEKSRYGRIEPEAFKNIMLRHERYYIHKYKVSDHMPDVLYAPVMNADGNTIAIACVPNVEKDLNFMRDAVFHTATIISVFMLILFIVVLIVSSITNAIFMPLWEMGKKMSAARPSDLEPIVYKGVDEISVLVEAYNNMVKTMRSSTVQLAEAERNKAWSEMARQVAHEIKNPLTPIKLELQRIIRLKQKGDPSWEEKFSVASGVILEHIDILSQTANEFSTFAKLYSEPPVEIDLGRMIQDQIFLFEDRGVDITFLGMDNIMFNGPKPQLTRVIFNVLSNAVQAVEETPEPKVMVSLRSGEGAAGTPCWVISVEDNGAGVSEQNLDKLFLPNFTTKSGGTGLGLAISRSVIENCGGTITYNRSFSLGGACFSINLPV